MHEYILFECCFSDVDFRLCVIVSHAPIVHQLISIEPLFGCVYLNASYQSHLWNISSSKYKILSNGSSSLTPFLFCTSWVSHITLIIVCTYVFNFFSSKFENIKKLKIQFSWGWILGQIPVSTKKNRPLEAEFYEKIASYVMLASQYDVWRHFSIKVSF